jgi:hypothetical protein
MSISDSPFDILFSSWLTAILLYQKEIFFSIHSLSVLTTSSTGGFLYKKKAGGIYSA